MAEHLIWTLKADAMKLKIGTKWIKFPGYLIKVIIAKYEYTILMHLRCLYNEFWRANSMSDASLDIFRTNFFLNSGLSATSSESLNTTGDLGRVELSNWSCGRFNQGTSCQFFALINKLQFDLKKACKTRKIISSTLYICIYIPCLSPNQAHLRSSTEIWSSKKLCRADARLDWSVWSINCIHYRPMISI